METLPYFRECRVGYQTSMSIPRVDGLSTGPPVLGRHNPCRKISLLGIAYPIEGSLFQVQGVYRRTALTRGRVLEESWIVDLILIFV